MVKVNQADDDVHLADAVERALKKTGIPITGPIVADYSVIDLPMDKVPAKRYEQAAEGGRLFKLRWGKMYAGMLKRGEKIPETMPFQIQTFRFGQGKSPFTLGPC